MDQKQFGVEITAGPQNWAILQQQDGFTVISLSGSWRLTADVMPNYAQVFVRVMSEEDGSEIITYMPCSMLSEQKWSVTLDKVPAGGLYRIETSLQIDDNPAKEWNVRGDMIHHIGVGDLWVIAGQSNAAGYGKGPFNDPPAIGIHLLRNSGQWDLASHPFNDSTKSIHLENSEQGNPGHSPFLAFAKMVRKETGYPIGLVQTALGGSPLSAWNPDENGVLYRNMMQIVQSVGRRVKGVLWYQGCSDCAPEESQTYMARFKRVVEAWRSDLSDTLLPVLTVQLNRYTAVQDTPAHSQPNSPIISSWGTLRETQRKAALEIPNVYVIPALDCPLSDEIHNSPAGNMLIGERLAKIALAEVYGAQVHHRAPNLSAASLGDVTVEGQSTIHLKFENVYGYLITIGPKEDVFAAEDTIGRIEITQWKIISKTEIQLVLARKPEGKTLVHGAYETNPAYFLPLDTGTYMPMLGFYGVEVSNFK
ncbi:MAG TPA: sialate O-acetylesterase [Bacilli bacterium]